jgi:hypothetical protein
MKHVGLASAIVAALHVSPAAVAAAARRSVTMRVGHS